MNWWLVVSGKVSWFVLSCFDIASVFFSPVIPWPKWQRLNWLWLYFLLGVDWGENEKIFLTLWSADSNLLGGTEDCLAKLSLLSIPVIFHNKKVNVRAKPATWSRENLKQWWEANRSSAHCLYLSESKRYWLHERSNTHSDRRGRWISYWRGRVVCFHTFMRTQTHT